MGPDPYYQLLPFVVALLEARGDDPHLDLREIVNLAQATHDALTKHCERQTQKPD